MRDQKRTSNLYTPKNVTAELLRYQHSKGEPNVHCSTPAPRVTALLSFSATLVLVLARLAGATTINANSASESDVAAVIGSAKNGDTVIMPAGTATWTRTLPVRKAITIQGAGIGVTIVKDGAQKGALIDWTLAAGLLSRLTGIEFQDGGRINVAAAPGGLIHIDGSNTDGSQFRWDHCKWNNLNGYPVLDTVIGVIDHNEIIVGTKVNEWLFPYGNRWNGGSYGDGSWAAPANWGSSQFLFIEDNTITGTNPTYEAQIIDCYGGARVVMRHNVIRGLTGNHGTESAGRTRGGRAMDIYANQITCGNVNRFIGNNRGGSELFHDNTITQCWGNLAQHSLATQRMIASFNPWGGADGTNQWDKNKSGAPFYSGTATGGGNLSVTVSGAGWSSDKWAGYSIKKSDGRFSYINSNTADTISYSDSAGYGTNLSFAAGDGFVINKVDQSIDQPGVGQSNLLSGDQPMRPADWNQVVEPCYMWGNTNDGAPYNTYTVNQANVKHRVHYFNNTALPGYTEYVYPHPLVTGNPPPSRTPSSPAATRTSMRKSWGGKQKEAKRVTKPGRKAKENAINEMAEGQENLDR